MSAEQLGFDGYDPRTHARTRDPRTSHTAAAATRRKETMTRRLLTVYDRNTWGYTAEEASKIAGYTPADGAWKRVSDLTNQGWLIPTGLTKKGTSGREQRILRITSDGERELRRMTR